MTFVWGAVLAAGVLLTVSPWLWPLRERSAPEASHGRIARLLEEQAVLAYRFDGRRYDCGSKLGYLEATVELGVKHAEVGGGFREFLARHADWMRS